MIQPGNYLSPADVFSLVFEKFLKPSGNLGVENDLFLGLQSGAFLKTLFHQGNGLYPEYLHPGGSAFGGGASQEKGYSQKEQPRNETKSAVVSDGMAV
jgi:hypothetical protein